MLIDFHLYPAAFLAASCIKVPPCHREDSRETLHFLGTQQGERTLLPAPLEIGVKWFKRYQHELVFRILCYDPVVVRIKEESFMPITARCSDLKEASLNTNIGAAIVSDYIGVVFE